MYTSGQLYACSNISNFRSSLRTPEAVQRSDNLRNQTQRFFCKGWWRRSRLVGVHSSINEQRTRITVKMLRPDRCRMLQRTAVLQSGATLKAVGSSSGVVFSAVVTVWNSWRHKTSVLEKAGCTTNRRKRFQYSLSNQICANFLRISASILLSWVPRCNLPPQKTCF